MLVTQGQLAIERQSLVGTCPCARSLITCRNILRLRPIRAAKVSLFEFPAPNRSARLRYNQTFREAFDGLGLFPAAGGESVHGEFGDTAAWTQPAPQLPPGAPPGAIVRDLVSGWVTANHARIGRICDVLLEAADASLRAQRPAIFAYATAGLIPRIEAAVANPHLVQGQLSERLANDGVLPMFGFPTRVRFLFNKRPPAGGKWPPDDVVDRPLDLAISQFAPASETVKEGLIQTAVGVVNYQRQGNHAMEIPTRLAQRSPSESAAAASRSTPAHRPRRDALSAAVQRPTIRWLICPSLLGSGRTSTRSGTTTDRSNGRRGPPGPSSAWVR